MAPRRHSCQLDGVAHPAVSAVIAQCSRFAFSHELFHCMHIEEFVCRSASAAPIETASPSRLRAPAGGYYMGMACDKIVAEALTITGSIGVVSGSPSLAQHINPTQKG